MNNKFFHSAGLCLRCGTNIVLGATSSAEMRKTMNRNHQWIRVGRMAAAGVLAVSVTLCSPSFTMAEKVKKEESVYVTTSATGDVTEVTVSDVLKNAGSGEVLPDISNLSEIENVKGEETFQQNGKKVIWQTQQEDIHYQGTSDQELPVSVSITYRLDGKEIAPEKLAGKSGKLTMSVAYENHSAIYKKINGKTEELFVPFVMVTCVILPQEHFSNIKVDNGKLVEEGNQQILVGYGMPGLLESLDVDAKDLEIPTSFEMTADVTEFTLGNTVTFASANVFSELFSKVDGDWDELGESVEKLADSSEKLVKGSGTLSDALDQLDEQFDEYASGEKKIGKGIDQLSSGSKTLEKGIQAYTKGSTSLAKGTKAYAKGAKQLADGTVALYDGVKDLPTDYQSFSAGLIQYTNGVDQLADQETANALKAGTAAVSGGISALNTGLGELKGSYASYDTIIQGLKTQAEQIEDEVQKASLLAYAGQLQALAESQKSSVTALEAATAKDSELKSGAQQVAAGVSQILSGAKTLSGSSQTLRDADSQLSSGITTLAKSAGSLKQGAGKLTKNNKKIISGANQLIQSGKQVIQGAGSLTEGVASLKKGSNQLTKATSLLADGIGELGEGADTLHTGMDTFDKKGIQKIYDFYQNDVCSLKERLTALSDASEEYDNFSGIGKNMRGEVKFIIKTEKIEQEKQ